MRLSVLIHAKDEHNFPWWKNKLSLLQHAHTDHCLGRCSVNWSEKGCVCIWITRYTANMHNSGSILFRFHYLQTQGVMQLPDLWGKWYSTENWLHIQQSYCVEPGKPLTCTQSLVNTIQSLINLSLSQVVERHGNGTQPITLNLKHQCQYIHISLSTPLFTW